MDPMIACCGLTCTECPAYLATQANDDEMRAKTAEMWSKFFKVTVAPETINCTGCSSDGVRFSHCDDCEIRTCAAGHNLANCGLCDDFACAKLDFIFKASLAAKELLEKIHASRG